MRNVDTYFDLNLGKERGKPPDGMQISDTIAAVSTPRGKGGIAVIRISGADTVKVLRRVFRPKKTDPIAMPRRACFGEIVAKSGEALDEGIAVYFRAPATFTGEDVAEISCHGGALLTEHVLGTVLAAGARPATAGEFTRRALVHGKMTLSSAEALGALLSADTSGQMALARGGMAGKLSAKIDVYYTRLSALLADVYAKIDFPDEDLASKSDKEVGEELDAMLEGIERLIGTWQTGRVVSEGVRTAICGPVNAGKSSLYNALVGRDAAIVTDVAGTTRDVLSETVALGDVTLRLFDTAGIRDTEDAVEEIGVGRARATLAEAELVLAVFDGSRAAGKAEKDFLAELKGIVGTVVIVVNKSDREEILGTELFSDFAHVVRISAKEGEISALTKAVSALYFKDGLNLREDAVVANARQYAALCGARDALFASRSALAEGFPPDVYAADAERAMRFLGEVDGRAVSEAIVADIFSHFCVGK